MIRTVKMVTELAPVTIKASAASEDGKTPGPPTFTALAYSGSPVPGHTSNPRLDTDYVIDLAGMTHTRNPKANLDHKPSQRVGHLTEFGNDGKAITVSGALSAATTFRDEVAKSAADGYGWEVSIEANLSKPRKLAAGKTEIVNGRTVTGPLVIFGKSVLTDIGFVSHGANDGNSVTIAASAAGASKMGEFEQFVVSCGADPETITSEQKATLTAAWKASQAGDSNPASKARKTWKDVADEEQSESERQDTIIKMGRDALREAPMYRSQINDSVEHAIESKMSADQFELELLRNTRVKAGTFSARMGVSADNDPKVIEAALCMSSGLPEMEKHFSEQVLDAVDKAGMRHYSIQSLLMNVANRNGYSCRAGEKIHVGNIRTVLEYCFPPKAFARMSGFSTTTLPNILGEVANKQILAGYMEADQTWREIASIRPVSNFYTQNFYRMLDNLEYEEVGSGGEIKHGTLGEETYTAQAKTYGKMLGLTRTQIINDDLGAFADIRERLGRGAAKKFSNVFWTAFIDNSTFFTAALTNYISGATTTLLTDGVGLGLAVAGFRQMTSPTADGSKRVGQDINPSILLVPPELEANAEQVYQNRNLGYVTAGTGVNIYAGKYKPVIQWRLSNSAFTGYSTTAWYLFGTEQRPMVVTFLNGQQTPTVESTEADFDTLGILFRGYHDFGCGKAEYLAGIKSKGAA